MTARITSVNIKSRNPSEKFWLNDWKVLFRDDNFADFFPTKDMNRNEQLNAITRYSIYLFIILLFFARSSYWLYIPVLIIGAVIVLKLIDTKDQRKDSPERKKEFEIKQTRGEIKEACQMPTVDNPFMNPLQTDYSNDRVKLPACRMENEGVDDGVKKYFNENLYMNADDLYERKNSQRQFFTLPVTTVPNDQTAFANWLYKQSDLCRYNGTNCLEYEDIRFH